jgi:hypothetical protein
MKNLEFEKQQQKLEQEIQKKLDDCFNNPNEKNKTDLFLLLIKKNSVKSIINKKSTHAPRFIERQDLLSEAYFVFEDFIKTGILKPEKRTIGLFIKKLKDSLYIIIRESYGIKRHTTKLETKYPEVLNYTNETQLENPIVQFDKILNPNQELMKEIKKEDLIAKIKFAKLSKNEEMVFKLAFNIDKNNKFLQKPLSLDNQEIANIINNKNNTNYPKIQIKDFKKNALIKLQNLYQPKEITISPDPTIIHYYKEWNETNGKIGKKQGLIKLQKLTCINKIDKKGQLLASKQFYTNKNLQQHDEYSNGALIKSTIYLDDNRTINYINIFNPKKNITIDDFKRNELLKNQTLLNKIKKIVELQKINITSPNQEKKEQLKKLTNETKKSFKLEKQEFIELINSIKTVGLQINR